MGLLTESLSAPNSFNRLKVDRPVDMVLDQGAGEQLEQASVLLSRADRPDRLSNYNYLDHVNE